MHFKLVSSVSFVVALAATVAQAAETKWYTTRSCDGSASLDYQNLGCNVCVDPSLGMFSTFIICDSMSMNIDENFNPQTGTRSMWYIPLLLINSTLICLIDHNVERY
jgi:hypothetical protein